MRVAPKATLTDEQRATLRRGARGRTTPMRLVRRAQILLLAAEGTQNIAIAEQLGIERTIAGRWRRRFAARGLAGLEKDAAWRPTCGVWYTTESDATARGLLRATA